MFTGQKGKEAVGNVPRVLQYYQLLGKNWCGKLRITGKGIFTEPIMMFCRALVVKHWSICCMDYVILTLVCYVGNQLTDCRIIRLEIVYPEPCGHYSFKNFISIRIAWRGDSHCGALVY
jgi:hypothetical protein